MVKVDDMTITIGGEEVDVKVKGFGGSNDASEKLVASSSKAFTYRVTIIDDDDAWETHIDVANPLDVRGNRGRYEIPFPIDEWPDDLQSRSWMDVAQMDAVVSDDSTMIAGPIYAFDELSETISVSDET